MTQNKQIISISVPGSIMLLGEHAVLYDYPAVVAAINRRITVELRVREDQKIFIYSELLGDYETSINNIAIENPFQFVLSAILQFQHQLMTGFDLKIQSNFSDKIGLGSSAAVTVATVGALLKWQKGKIDFLVCYKQAYDAVLHIQGVGSGADVAASVFGGVIYYQKKPFKVEPLSNQPSIRLIYSGYKTPTTDVIRHVDKLAEEDPKLFESLYSLIGQCATLGAQAIQDQDWRGLGDLFKLHQSLQHQLGVSDDVLNHILEILNNQPKVLGAKISGAGLGDCVVVLGEFQKDLFMKDKMRVIDVEIETQGLIEEGINE